MVDYYIAVNPIIVYPSCVKSGKEQDCFICKLQKGGKCQSTRSFCVKYYTNHKKGCPNYNKRKDCPPNAPMFDQVFDLTRKIYAIFSIYNLQAHVDKMRERHPHWTETQLLNVLYWQGTARKQLKGNIQKFSDEFRKYGYYSTTSPEAMGVDVTQTMKDVGIILEWPARKFVYKVAMAGIPLNDRYIDILK